MHLGTLLCAFLFLHHCIFCLLSEGDDAESSLYLFLEARVSFWAIHEATDFLSLPLS